MVSRSENLVNNYWVCWRCTSTSQSDTNEYGVGGTSTSKSNTSDYIVGALVPLNLILVSMV